MNKIQDMTNITDLSIERIYQEIRIIFNDIDRNSVHYVDLSETYELLYVVFEYFSINEDQYEQLFFRIFKTMDFFPLAYEMFMSSIASESDVMHNLRLPKEYANWVLFFEEFSKTDLSETVYLKDLLERLNGDYDLVLKFCLYFEIYDIKNGYETAIKSIKSLREKANNGEEEPFHVTHLKIGGKDLKDRGFEGRQIGIKMREVLQHVKAKPEFNSRNVLLNMI